MPSMFSSVVKRLPVSLTGRKSSATLPSRIMNASPAEKVNISMLVVPPNQLRA